MATWQYELRLLPKESLQKYYGSIPRALPVIKKPDEKIEWWKGINVDIQDIEARISKVIPIDKNIDPIDAISWKGYEERQDNDVWIDYSEKELISFIVRIDYRDPNMKFLKEILQLAKDINAIFVNKSYNTFEPNIKALIQEMSICDSALFKDGLVQEFFKNAQLRFNL